MISSLYIKNIALISELNINFDSGLNILSGETGAGKSIIIDSLNFVLGDRADRSLIRYGETTARVEVIFENVNTAVQQELAEFGLDIDDDNLIITRTMTESKSECRINGRIVTLATLRSIVCLLVDVHTQNEHQSLLKVSNHLKLLDNYSSEISPILSAFSTKYKDYNDIKENLSEFLSAQERDRQIDVLRYQIDELTDNMPQEDEEETLLSSRTKFYNQQKITNSLAEAQKLLDGSNAYGLGVVPALQKAISELVGASKYDNECNEYVERLESAKIEIDDILSTIDDKLYRDDYANTDIDSLEKRLEQIRLIKKKYGKTQADIATFLENAKEKLSFLENAEASVAKLNIKLNSVGEELIELTLKLHSARTRAASLFEKAILEHLSELGMKNTVFKVNIDFPEKKNILDSLTHKGCDKVEFMLSPNVGEPLKQLIAIASGGEMSRFMLAVKNVVAELDGISTLVFDEIDTGISGKIAKEVAKKLYNIAKKRQVLAITHLPQLASMADTQYLISKEVKDGKTLTQIKLLDEGEIYKEIMRLAGSAENSEIGLEHAKELKQWANSYKSTSK